MAVKVRHAFLLSLLAMFIILPSVQAVGVLESQEDVTLTLERGSTYEFPLMLRDVDESMELSIDGEIEDWVGFGNGMESKITITAWQPYVILKIEIPDDEELGEYDGEILAGDSVISEMIIKVTLDLSNVIANEEVADLQDKVDILTDSVRELRSHVATLEYNVSEKVGEIYEYQKDLNMLEKENEELTEKNIELEEKYIETATTNEELNDLTGALVGTQLPGMFIGGMLIGVITMVTILNRGEVKRRLKKKLGMTVEKPHHKEFKYSFKS